MKISFAPTTQQTFALQLNAIKTETFKGTALRLKLQINCFDATKYRNGNVN